jgi:hypothetical protein
MTGAVLQMGGEGKSVGRVIRAYMDGKRMMIECQIFE